MADEGGILIRSDERMFIVGQTGSGKSTFARALLLGPPIVSRLVMVDPKDEMMGLYGVSEWDDRQAHRDMRQGRPARLRFAPPPGEEADWDGLYRELFYTGNLTVYIDELTMALPAGAMHRRTWLHGLYQQGRVFDIRVIGATQRPRHVPIPVIESCQWYVMFRTPFEDDRRVMAGYMGEAVMELPRHRYGFWIRHVSWSDPRYYPGIVLPQRARTVRITEERLEARRRALERLERVSSGR